LESLENKEEKIQSKKSNDDASNSKDDDFTDLVDEINKLTQ